MMNSIDIQKKDSKYIANTYKRFPIALTAGEGVVARDPEGKHRFYQRHRRELSWICG